MLARKVFALLFFAVAVMSACGDSADDSVASATTTTTATTLPTQTQECGQVAFTPDSEDAASDIRATGLDCEEARAFVERAGRQTSSGGPDSVEVDGWACQRTAHQSDPLPTSTYECTNATKNVTFVRS